MAPTRVSLALITILATQAIIATPSSAKETPASRNPDQLEKLFTNLEGDWQCHGATAGGTQTAADISFIPDGTGKVYTFTQVGTKGHTNTLTSTWAFDQPMENLVVSRRYISPEGVSTDMFVGEHWTANTLTLAAKELWGELWAQHRFRYEVQPGQFKVTWEVLRGDVWKMGDYLVCSK